MNNTNIYYIFALIFIIILYINYDIIDNFFVGVPRGKKALKKPKKIKKLESNLESIDTGNNKKSIQSLTSKAKEVALMPNKGILARAKKAVAKERLTRSMSAQQKRKSKIEINLAKEYKRAGNETQKGINKLQKKMNKEMRKNQAKIEKLKSRMDKRELTYTKDYKKLVNKLSKLEKSRNKKLSKLKTKKGTLNDIKKKINNKTSKYESNSIKTQQARVRTSLFSKLRRTNGLNQNTENTLTGNRFSGLSLLRNIAAERVNSYKQKRSKERQRAKDLFRTTYVENRGQAPDFTNI